MNYYEEIKNKLIDDEVYARVKDYSKERHRVITYFEIGRLLAEAGSVYGEDVIGEYSRRLTIELGKKYTKNTLFRIRKYYKMFSNEKVATLLQLFYTSKTEKNTNADSIGDFSKKVAPVAPQLTWSHILLLLPIKDINEILYYIGVCIERHADVRTLSGYIKSHEYERLPEEAKNKLIANEEPLLTDMIKEPVIINNKYDKEVITEKALHRLILEDDINFCKNLGTGFSMVDHEYKIKIGDYYNYIDFLLYNIKYHCYVVVEIKTTELKKEHIGQIQVYMNYIDKNVRSGLDGITIGIIICKKNNKYIIEYCSNPRIISREYELK